MQFHKLCVIGRLAHPDIFPVTGVIQSKELMLQPQLLQQPGDLQVRSDSLHGCVCVHVKDGQICQPVLRIMAFCTQPAVQSKGYIFCNHGLSLYTSTTHGLLWHQQMLLEYTYLSRSSVRFVLTCSTVAYMYATKFKHILSIIITCVMAGSSASGASGPSAAKPTIAKTPIQQSILNSLLGISNVPYR